MRFVIVVLFLVTNLSVAQTKRVRISKFNSSACNLELDPYRLRTRIMEKELDKNVMTVNIATVATCCADFLPSVLLKNGVLYLDIKETGNECECSCCYQFAYQIKGINDENIEIKFRGQKIDVSKDKFKTFPIRFYILKSDTINYVDRYGLKQGKWAYRNDSLMTTGYYECVDDIIVKLVRFHPDGTVKSVATKERIKVNNNGTEYHEYSNYNKYVEYFESGAIKQECLSTDFQTSAKEGKCKEWNDKGELIYEGPFKR